MAATVQNHSNFYVEVWMLHTGIEMTWFIVAHASVLKSNNPSSSLIGQLQKIDTFPNAKIS